MTLSLHLYLGRLGLREVSGFSFFVSETLDKIVTICILSICVPISMGDWGSKGLPSTSSPAPLLLLSMDIETFGNTNNGDSYVAVDEDVEAEKEDGDKKEEGDMNRVIWENFSDQDILGWQGQILSKLTPDQFFKWFKYIIPALNPLEQQIMLGGFKENAPAEAYSATINGLKPFLNERQFNHIQSI